MIRNETNWLQFYLNSFFICVFWKKIPFPPRKSKPMESLPPHFITLVYCYIHTIQILQRYMIEKNWWKIYSQPRKTASPDTKSFLIFCFVIFLVGEPDGLMIEIQLTTFNRSLGSSGGWLAGGFRILVGKTTVSGPDRSLTASERIYIIIQYARAVS